MSRLLAMFPTGLVLTDGAWGTEFQTKGLPPGQPADLWNVERPDDVIAVARSYVEAGSRVVLTNTFRANAIAMEGRASDKNHVAINTQGVLHSKAAAGDRAKVFASIGPTGKMVAMGELEPDRVIEVFKAQAEALAEGGADALLFETFSDIEEARLAIQAAKGLGLPVLISFAFDSGKNKDRTMMGSTPEQAAKAAVEEGADAVGANCGAGPDAFVPTAKRLKEASGGLPVWIKPNAGLPVMEGGRAVYAMTPSEFATFRAALVEAGADFLGGCCGTSPAFIQALAKAGAEGAAR
jgi:methionine synthase I (cobalamin-dependent)